MGDEQVYADTCMDACEVDPGLYAAHRLTPDQRRHFDEQGYLLIEDALPPDLFHECKRLLLGMAADEVAKGAHAAAGTDRGGFAAVTAACFSQANHLQRTALAKLLTTEKVLPKVIDIMGSNTTCYHFHCNVTSSMGGSVLDEGDDSDGGAPSHPDFQQVPCFGYHQDSGLQADCEHRPAPRFSMKAGYFFTDVPPGGKLLSGNPRIYRGGQSTYLPLSLITAIPSPDSGKYVDCPPRSSAGGGARATGDWPTQGSNSRRLQSEYLPALRPPPLPRSHAELGERVSANHHRTAPPAASPCLCGRTGAPTAYACSGRVDMVYRARGPVSPAS
eukprot:COSAG01_NODE_624_length_14732_cov_58.900772_5_plen_331_part_00